MSLPIIMRLRWLLYAVSFVFFVFGTSSRCRAQVRLPYVDKYGQKITAAWPEKIVSDANLANNWSVENIRLKAWDGSGDDYDPYGGWKRAGWHVTGSGYYTVVQHDGIWWLITPNGYPCFYKGVDTAPSFQWETTPVTGREELFQDLPAKDGPFAKAWSSNSWGSDPGISTYAFCASNLIRKYGSGWESEFRQVTNRRLKDWGFSGVGKWADSAPPLPSLPVLERPGVPTVIDGGHPDPFDPATAYVLRNVLKKQIQPRIDDPTVVAWSLGNEGAELIQPEEIADILSLPSTVPAKKALIDYAVDTLYHGSVANLAQAWGDNLPVSATRNSLYNFVPQNVSALDIEQLRDYYADKYYALVERTVKSIDPHHLYAGFWIVEGFYTDEADWKLIARNCDVIGFDCYDTTFAAHDVNRLISETKKPVMCGEFSFPQSDADRGFSQFGDLSMPSEEDSGNAYSHYVSVAAQNPYCVGVNWFQYRDEPVTGRGPGSGPDLVYGENYAFGLVDITDTPKWTLLEYVRKANLKAVEDHAMSFSNQR